VHQPGGHRDRQHDPQLSERHPITETPDPPASVLFRAPAAADGGAPSRWGRRVDVSGSVCVVTGGSGGIGHALAMRLAREGARVIAVGRDPGALAEIERRARARTIRAALTVAEAVDRCAPEALA